MHKQYITPSILLTLFLSVLMIILSLASEQVTALLEFNRQKISYHEYWRLLSGNFIHYGLMHLAMNMAAFLMLGFTILRDLSIKIYAGLLLSCALAVCTGTLFYNPELLFYRGFSGVLHGLLIAGLLLHKFQKPWLNYVFISLVFVKIIHEHQANFKTTPLQDLLPVMVAVDSHLYGAIAGLIYTTIIILRLKMTTVS